MWGRRFRSKPQHCDGHALLVGGAMLHKVASMIQLTYEPALDPYHTTFRFLRLRPVIAQHGPLHRDHARILDFYQLFPFRIAEIRLTPKHRKFRKLAEK